MSSKIKVLVFPAGEINSIELHDALATCVNIELYGASSVERHGDYVFKNYIKGLPKINEYNFLEELNALIANYNIDVIIPTHDDVALYMAKNRDKIRARIVTGSYETNCVCRDKEKTYKVFEKYEFCPKIYENICDFPVLIKPKIGQGSVGIKLLNSKEEIPINIDWTKYVICEYLPGKEFTVDCFTDKDGKLQCIMPRSRKRTLAGVSVCSEVVPLIDDIAEIANIINNELELLGLWYFQVKEAKNGKYKLLEVSTRCAGTMCVTRAMGVNLPLLSVYAAMGRTTSIMKNEYNLMVDRTLISRYKTDIDYDTVYVDLDDTLIVDGMVNLQLVSFLYQCVNKGKYIILLTRHVADHKETAQEYLTKYRIFPELFDEIIEVKDFSKSKIEHIGKDNAILIDNSFLERKEAKDKKNIQVFDVDTVEVLLDWRK